MTAALPRAAITSNSMTEPVLHPVGNRFQHQDLPVLCAGQDRAGRSDDQPGLEGLQGHQRSDRRSSPAGARVGKIKTQGLVPAACRLCLSTSPAGPKCSAASPRRRAHSSRPPRPARSRPPRPASMRSARRSSQNSRTPMKLGLRYNTGTFNGVLGVYLRQLPQPPARHHHRRGHRRQPRCCRMSARCARRASKPQAMSSSAGRFQSVRLLQLQRHDLSQRCARRARDVRAGGDQGQDRGRYAQASAARRTGL